MTHTKNILFGIIGFVIGFLAITFLNNQSIEPSSSETLKEIQILSQNMLSKPSLVHKANYTVDYAYLKNFNQEICKHMDYHPLEKADPEFKDSIYNISTSCKKLAI